MRHPGRLVVLLLSASCLSAEELPSPPTMEALLEEAIRAEGDVQLALLARMAVGGDPAVAALHKPEVLNLPNFQITLRAAETLSQKKTDDDYVQFVHLYRNALELQLILAGEEAVKANLYRRIFLEATPRATETALSLAQKDLDRILTLDDPLWTLVFSEETYGGARRFLIRQMTPENAVSRQALLLKCLRAATDKKQRALLAVPLLPPMFAATKS